MRFFSHRFCGLQLGALPECIFALWYKSLIFSTAQKCALNARVREHREGKMRRRPLQEDGPNRILFFSTAGRPLTFRYFLLLLGIGLNSAFAQFLHFPCDLFQQFQLSAVILLPCFSSCVYGYTVAASAVMRWA